MSCSYRPVGSLIPANDGAIVVGFRTSAPHLAKTPALGGSLISEFFYEFIIFIMSSSLTIVVNQISISEKRTAPVVQRGPFAQQ